MRRGPVAYRRGSQPLLDPAPVGDGLRDLGLREVLEESGVVCSLLPGGYLGMFSDSYAHNHYYMALQVRKNLSPHDHETKAVKLATFDEAEALFTGGGSETTRDRRVLASARAWVEAFKKKNGIT